MRIGIIALLHESNTFVQQGTTLERFYEDLFLEGDFIKEQLASSHHEIGGFFAGLAESEHTAKFEAVPLLAARATPAGVISGDAWRFLIDHVIGRVHSAEPLDGILVAPHGAAVSECHPDADGYWLSRLRLAVGPRVPIIGTLDLHANLSQQMVDSCTALIAYRTNPHLDQRERGRDAARLMIATLLGEVQPTMAASFPPLVVNIQRQCTSEAHWRPIYTLADEQLKKPAVLSNSILLGFPYADVPEMGAAAVVVTDRDAALAQQLAHELGEQLWAEREAFRGQLTSVASALEQCAADQDSRICLLDMGDNVGGGSTADGTTLAQGLLDQQIGPSFVCLCDPESVEACGAAGIGAQLQLRIGGKTDGQHGSPLEVDVHVVSLHDGRFQEAAPRHGGIVEFDQGPTAIVTTAEGQLTLMLTTRRMVPFSLQQIIHCQLDPLSFRVLVAKGVNAPIAAYRDVCDCFIRVNTIGSTSADLTKLMFTKRRRPLFPFEECEWTAGREE